MTEKKIITTLFFPFLLQTRYNWSFPDKEQALAGRQTSDSIVLKVVMALYYAPIRCSA